MKLGSFLLEGEVVPFRRRGKGLNAAFYQSRIRNTWSGVLSVGVFGYGVHMIVDVYREANK
jgi:hypothetical protein